MDITRVQWDEFQENPCWLEIKRYLVDLSGVCSSFLGKATFGLIEERLILQVCAIKRDLLIELSEITYEDIEDFYAKE